MKPGLLVPLCGTAMAMLFDGPALHAGSVTFSFTGEVTRVSDPLNLLGGSVEVGSPLLGSYTFESTTPDSNPDPSQGIYENPILGLSGTVGGVQFTGPALSRQNAILVHDATQDDLYIVRSGTLMAGVVLDFGLFFGDTTGLALSADALPAFPPDLQLFEFRGIGISDTLEVIPLLMDAQLTSLVPDPATGLLLLVGAAWMTRPRRTQRRHRRIRLGASVRRRTALSFVQLLGATAILTSARHVRAADCNSNGIDDRTEFNSQCRVDLVFIIDTSTSISPDTMNLIICPQIGVAISNLTAAGIMVTSAEKLRISPDPPPPAQFRDCSCCNSSVAQAYGTTTPGMPEMLAACSNPEGALEDWGVAAGIVAGNKAWTANALRIIVPMSDERENRENRGK